jgi:hypothetical protein
MERTAVANNPYGRTFFERSPNWFDMHRNPTMSIYVNASVKSELDSPCYSRILDGPPAPEGEFISKRVESGVVPGANWHNLPRFEKVDSAPDVGPGKYDVERWHNHPKFAKKRVVKFDMAENGKNSGGDKIETPPKMSLEELHALSAREEAYHRANPPRSCRTIRWSAEPRFKPLFKPEKYASSGLPLSADYDAYYTRKDFPYSFDTHERHRIPPVSKAVTAGIRRLYNTDVGPKASTGVQVLQSPIRYHGAFQSGAKKGMHIPMPTSGTGGGPGNPIKVLHDGRVASAVNILFPGKESLMFLPDSKPPEPFMTPDPYVGFRAFGEGENLGVAFPKAGQAGPNELRKEAVEKSFHQLYPRKGRALFGKCSYQRPIEIPTCAREAKKRGYVPLPLDTGASETDSIASLNNSTQ